MTEKILEQSTFREEWIQARDQAFYDTPQEALTKALFRIGRTHTPRWIELFTFERRYIQLMVNKSYGF